MIHFLSNKNKEKVKRLYAANEACDKIITYISNKEEKMKEEMSTSMGERILFLDSLFHER